MGGGEEGFWTLHLPDTHNLSPFQFYLVEDL